MQPCDLLATAHFKDIVSHTDDEYQYTLIVNTLAPILVRFPFDDQVGFCLSVLFVLLDHQGFTRWNDRS